MDDLGNVFIPQLSKMENRTKKFMFGVKTTFSICSSGQKQINNRNIVNKKAQIKKYIFKVVIATR